MTGLFPLPHCTDIKDFIMQPDSTTEAVGSEAVLTCVTGRSAPYPTVHWEMDGVRLENANTQTASYGEFDPTGLSAQISMKLMYTVVADDPRSFRCVARNPLSGETVKSFAATVTPTGEGGFARVALCEEWRGGRDV